MISGFIGLSYEFISSYLDLKRQQTLKNAFSVMKRNLNLAKNRIFHLGEYVIIYGIYNAESIEKIVKAITKLHSKITFSERVFSTQLKIGMIGI